MDEESIENDPRSETPPAPYAEIPDVREPFANFWRIASLAGLAAVIAIGAYHIGLNWGKP